MRALRVRTAQTEWGGPKGRDSCVGFWNYASCSVRGKRGATVEDAAQEVPSDHRKLALAVALSHGSRRFSGLVKAEPMLGACYVPKQGDDSHFFMRPAFPLSLAYVDSVRTPTWL
jgi:hypothetical protein